MLWDHLAVMLPGAVSKSFVRHVRGWRRRSELKTQWSALCTVVLLLLLSVRTASGMPAIEAAGISGAMAVLAARSDTVKLSNASETTGTVRASGTNTAAAAWATQTSGGMQQASDGQNTIILHSDPGLS